MVETSIEQMLLSPFAIFIRFSFRTIFSWDTSSSYGTSSSSSFPRPNEDVIRSCPWCWSPSSSLCSSMGSSRAAPAYVSIRYSMNQL